MAQGAQQIMHTSIMEHSSYEHAVEVAIKANVKKLIITHHDPDHNDDFLDSMQYECQKLFPNSIFAKEGMEVLV